MSKSYELEGKIHLINDIQTFDSGFSKREFVVETTDSQYPQMVKFECVKDRTSLTDGLNQGDPVVVHFDIRGNEYQGRYYVNLNCWKLDRSGGGTAPPAAGPPPSSSSDPLPTEPPGGISESEDIPF